MSNPTTHVSAFGGSASGWSLSGPERYDGGLWLEEGTTNLPADPSGESGSSGWGKFGTTVMTRVADHAVDGSWSHEFSCDGSAANQGCAVTSGTGLGTMSARTFVGSIFAEGSGVCDIWTVAVYTDMTTTSGSKTAVTIGSSDRYEAEPVATDPAKTLNYVQVYLRTKTAQSVIFWADAAQIEEKSYATSYTSGTRAASSASISPANHLLPGNGSLAFRFRRLIDTGGVETLLECGTDGDDWMKIYIDASDKLNLWWSSGGALPTYVTSVESIAVDTEYFVYAEWDDNTQALSINNGAKVVGTRDTVVGDWGAGPLTLKAE